MMIYFREAGSRKLLKELNLDIKPTIKELVKIHNTTYCVYSVILDTSNATYTVWLRKYYQHV